MAVDQKITELTAITGDNVSIDDVLALVDISASETKKITRNELIIALTKGANPLVDGANISTDLSLGNVHTVTLQGNRTLDNPTNKTVGQTFFWIITQDGTGSRTLAFGSDFDFQGTELIESKAAAVTVIQGTVVASSSIRCVVLARNPGLKQYLGDGTDFSISSSPAVSVLTRAVAIPFQTSDGAWWLIFSTEYTVASGTRGSAVMTISGVNAKSGPNQAVSACQLSGNTGFVARAFAGSGSGNVSCFHASATTAQYSFAGIYELNAKPTWAD